MKLAKYDNKLIRLTTNLDEIFEGICYFNSKDYTYHEFGVNEESLQIICFLFYKSDIKKIELIDSFSDKYGYLEKLTVESGYDLIDEFFSCEENVHIKRLLLYMIDNTDLVLEIDKVINGLNTLIKYNDDKEVIKLATKLKGMISHEY